MRTSFAAAAVATTLLVSGTAADAAPVFASDAFIDVGAGQAGASELRFGPDNAFDDGTDGDFYSLGVGGKVIFTFGDNILGPGTVFEVTFNCRQQQGDEVCSNYPESADLYGIAGDIDLAGLEDGEVEGVQNYDLTSFLTAPFVTQLASIPNGNAQSGFSFDTGGMVFSGLLLVDTSAGGNGRDGFDVASISATPVPLPPAAALLFGALGGLGLVRRRGA